MFKLNKINLAIFSMVSVVLFSGCSITQGGISEGCLSSMSKAAQELDPSAAERFLQQTAENCGGKSEWYQALRKYPYAMGFADVTGNEWEILCYRYKTTPACVNP